MTSQNPRDHRDWMRTLERNQGKALAIPAIINQAISEVIDGVEEVSLRHPAAPVELNAQTMIYADPTLRQQVAVLNLDFPNVTFNTDGTDAVIQQYELWGYRVLPGDEEVPDSEKPWAIQSTNQDSNFTKSPYDPGSLWAFRARAIGIDSVQPGEWSEDLQVQMIADTVPPPQPTAPTVEAERGTLTVKWDGLSPAGPMPLDLDYVVLARGTTSSPTDEVTKFSAAGGFIVITDAEYYVPEFFRLRAVDYSGNVSPWSEQATGFTTPLVDVDIILSELDAGKVTIKNANKILLETGVELGVKLAENEEAVTSAQAEIDAIVVDVDAVEGALTAVEAKADAAAANASAANTAAGEAQTAAGVAKADALAAVGIANSKGKVLVQPAAPGAGDRNANTLWIDTTGGLNTPKRWVSGTQWQAVTDKVATDAAAAVIVAKGRADEAFNKAVDAATAAGNALTAANGKTRNWHQATKPAGTGHNVNDTWFKSPENLIHRWNGSDWVSIQDTDIADAKQAAVDAEAAGNAADTKAVNAQNRADQAAADALAAQNAANAAATLASNVITTTTTVATGIPPAKNAMWVQTNAAGTLVIKTWTANAAGTAWVVSQLDDAVIGNLNAATINAGILNAARLNATDIRAKFLAAGKITAADITTGTLTSTSGIFGTMDASVINAGTLNAARLNATDIRAKFLQAGKITAADMVAGTITATSGIIGSLDAAVIVAKSITGDKLAFNTISAQNLIVRDTNNLYPDPNFDLGLGWLGSTGGWIEGDWGTLGGIKKISYKNTAPGSSVYMPLLPDFGINVVGGQDYYVACDVAVTGGTAPNANMRVCWYDFDTKTNHNIGAGSSTALPDSGTPKTVGGIVSLPVGTWKIQPRMTFYSTAGTGETFHVTNVRVYRAASGELIVDGAVTAGSIATNAITSDKILANAITTAKINAGAVTVNELAANSVNASKIVGLSITAAELAANSVTAGKINVDAVTAREIKALTITADQLAANTITADKINVGSISAVILTADAITGGMISGTAIDGMTITGGKFQTTTQVDRGVQFDSTGIKAWTPTGQQSFEISAATGFATISGRFRSAMPGQPGVVIVPSSESGDGTTMGVWFTPNVDNIPGQVTGGIWTAKLPNQMITTYPLHIRGAYGGGVKVWNNLEIQGVGSLPAQVVGANGLTLQTTGTQPVDVVNRGYDYTMMHKAFGGAGCYNGYYLNGNHLALVGAGGRFGNHAGIEALGSGIRLITGAGYNISAPAMYSRTSGNAANIFVGSDGGLWRSTSALKYKAMVAEMELPKTLLDVKVKDWRDKLSAERYADSIVSRTIGCLTESESAEFDAIDIARIPGAIAEEVLAAGGGSFVQYGPDGEVEGLMYDRFTLARTQLLNDKLNKAIERIEELEARLNNAGDTA